MHLKRFHHFLISHWMTSRIACSRVLPWRLIKKMFAAVEMSGQDLKEPTNFKSQGCVDWFVLCQVGKGYEKWNEVAWNWCNVGFCKASWQPQNCWMSFGVRTDWSGMNPAKQWSIKRGWRPIGLQLEVWAGSRRSVRSCNLANDAEELQEVAVHETVTRIWSKRQSPLAGSLVCHLRRSIYGNMSFAGTTGWRLHFVLRRLGIE